MAAGEDTVSVIEPEIWTEQCGQVTEQARVCYEGSGRGPPVEDERFGRVAVSVLPGPLTGVVVVFGKACMQVLRGAQSILDSCPAHLGAERVQLRRGQNRSQNEIAVEVEQIAFTVEHVLFLSASWALLAGGIDMSAAAGV